MLTQLRVKNYALIKDLVFKPGQSFNVITGETGAGKSILLGAMGLILGERTDSIAVKENEEKCIIEGYFDIKAYLLKNWFEHNELDFCEELIIRREILINGKSRAFINDTPAQLDQLKELGKFLIDIHSQHDNLDLFQKSFQFRVLDSFTGIESHQKIYIKNFEALKALDKKLTELKLAEKHGTDERDYKQFLYEELLVANLIEGETLLLEEELLALSNVDQNLQILATIHNQLTESETAIIDQLALIKNQLNQVAKNDKRFEEICTRFSEINYSFKDLAIEIDQLAQATNLDPERLDIINQRLSLLHNLAKKHRDEDLILKQKTLEQELSKFAHLDSEIQTVEIERQTLEKECFKLANSNSKLRKEQSLLLEKQINEMIVQLGMPGGRIKVEVSLRNDKELWIYGINDTNFIFTS